MSRHMYSLITAVALGCASIASHAQSTPTNHYHLTLMQVPGNPPVPADVADINNRNEIVGSYVPSGSTRARSFIWRNGVFRDLTPLLGDRLQSPRSINDKSAILGVVDFVTAFVIRHGRVTEIAPPAGERLFRVLNLNNHGQALFQTRSDA